MSVGAASRRGLGINFAAQGVRFALQFVVTVVLSRLLKPNDFGLLAMASPVLAFVWLFADLGLTQATVLRATISQRELTFLFWVSADFGALVCLALILTAPLVAAFYDEPRITGIVCVLATSILLNGLYSQHVALLNRRLAFGALAIVEVGGLAIGAAAGLAIALAGGSYWAIVLNQVIGTAASLLLAWMLARWRPSLPKSVESARSLLNFGGNVTGFNLVNFFARNADNILIGRVLGEVPLGLYDRGYKLLLLPLSQISGPIAKVAIPMLARSVGEPGHYRRSYLRLLEIILLLTYPGVVFACVASRPLIAIVLGPQWSGAAPVFQILAVGALFAPVSNSTGWLFLTQDRSREMRDFGIVSSLAFVCSFVAGLPWGITGVAGAYILVGCVQGPAVWWAATRRGPVTFAVLVRAILPYWIASVPVAIVSLLCLGRITGWISLAVMLAAAYVVFAAAMTAMPRGRTALRDVQAQVAALLRTRSRGLAPG